MLEIRLARVGKKNRAQFQIVLQEHAIAPGGRHVEILGSYDPHSKATTLKEERIKYWLSKGAQASPTVHNLLVSKNVVSGEKIAIKISKKKEEAKEETKKEEPEAGAKPEETKAETKIEEVKTEAKTEPASSAGEEPKKEEKAEEVKKEEPKKAEEEKTESAPTEIPADK